MFTRHDSERAGRFAIESGDVGQPAGGQYHGSQTDGEYHAVWDVPEPCQSCSRCCDICGARRANAHALYTGNPCPMGTWRCDRIAWQRTFSGQHLQTDVHVGGGDPGRGAGASDTHNSVTGICPASIPKPIKMDITLPTETRLAWGALVLLVVAAALALLGERTLAVFGGDRELAERFYKTIYVGLGAGIIALVAPLAVSWFVGRLRALFMAAQSDSAITQLLLRDDVPQLARIVGLALMALFVLAGIAAAINVWTRGG